MRVLCACTILSALMVAGCASSKGESYVRAGFDFGQLDKVAIVDVTGVVRGDAAKNQISDFFAMELVKRGYTVVERAKAIDVLRKEQQFQESGITSEEGAAKAGRILNVPAVVLISIPKYDENMSMTAKLVGVEDASILWIGSGFGTTGRTGSTALGAILGAAAGAVVAGGDTRDRVAGGIIGGVVGGVAGSALTPQQEQQIQKLIKTVTENLPYRFMMKRQ